MDLPPLIIATSTATATATTATSIHLNYPDSVESSPGSNAVETFNEPIPPLPGAKLRLMCSYGGHIIPRPHDKSLCYVGGDTRIVVVDRHTSLATLCSRISRTLLNGRSFSLKYQLPNEDLDNLVSVTTDEDLDNLIEEYDRITSSTSSLSPARIRLFIFFNRPETVASMGSLLDDAKSETWFVDAINGSGLIPKNLSDSATMACLVNLEDDDVDQDLEAERQGDGTVGMEKKPSKDTMTSDVNNDSTALDSPNVENGSSFGSPSSSPSTANLPPIRVCVEDQKATMEEQLAQLSIAHVAQKQDDGYYGVLSAVPPLPASIRTCGSSENLNRVVSDEERLDQGGPGAAATTAYRKPPLAPLQVVVQQQLKGGGNCYNLPSPDSVASDNSVTSASSLSKTMYYQEPQGKPEISIPNSQIQLQQVQDSSYTVPPQIDQPQQHFVHATTTHFVPHPAAAAATAVPVSSYFPVYAAAAAPNQQHHHYVVPVLSQTQPYMSMQASMLDNGAVFASNRPLAHQVPAVVAASAAYRDTHPQIYPTKIESASAAYGTTATVSTPQLVQVPVNQFQQPFAGYSPMQHPSHSIPAAASSNYSYEYANATHDHVYYTHQPQAAAAAVATLPPQYQTMTPAAAVALADASAMVQTATNTMQQMGTSQPL